jgi:allantoinase
MSDLVIRAGRAIMDGAERAAAVLVGGGRITAVLPRDAEVGTAREVVLADDEVLLPGLVDTHVHVNEPGRTEWEGFATATRAAAAGGVMTLIDMPLNSLPPTIDVAALEAKRTAASGQCAVDVGFWGGAVPGNTSQLRALHEAGVVGLKSFLAPSGVEEFPPLPAGELAAALREVASFGGLMIVHAEDPAVLEAAPVPAGPRYAGFLRSRPRAAEDSAIATLLRLARETGARVHVLHLSSAAALPLLAAAKADGVAVTVETCPHYLTLTAEEIADGDTRFKCCPPIREAANRDALWRGLADGTIDLVVSDHSPCPPELKDLAIGDFGTAWGGIASVQLGLPAVWTEARRRGHGLAELVGWMATRPAELVGLARKGRIAPGYDADLAVLAPEQAFVVDAGRLHHRNPVTPYAGRELHGAVRRSWLRGEPVSDAPRGRLLARGEA